MDIKKLKITVIYGGTSSEREVSLRSGKAVYNALRRAGFESVELFDLRRDTVKDIHMLDTDLAYLALHGKGGEDGCIQGMLELLGIPYTGSGVLASASCMDKIRTKEILEKNGLPTPAFVKVSRSEVDDRGLLTKRLVSEIGLPMVLKSPCEGSSIGVYIARTAEDVEGYAKEVFSLGDTLLCEAFADGVEVTLPVMGNGDAVTLPIIEITSENEFYDFESKYTQGMCKHILPARISESQADEVARIGRSAYTALGCAGLARIDFIIDKTRGPMVIEINTLPGMTDMSLFPDSARHAGVSFEELVTKIVGYACENFIENKEQ